MSGCMVKYFSWGQFAWQLTDDIATVVRDESLAVNIDELCDQRLGELGVCPQAAEGDVLRPLVLNWERGGNRDSVIPKAMISKYSKD